MMRQSQSQRHYFGTNYNPSGNHYVPQCSGGVTDHGTRMLRTPVLYTEEPPSPPKTCPGINACWMVGGEHAQFMTYAMEDELSEMYENQTSVRFQSFDFMGTWNGTFQVEGGLFQDYELWMTHLRPFYAYMNHGHILEPFAEVAGVSPCSASVPLPDGGRLAIMALNCDLPGRPQQLELDAESGEWRDVSLSSLQRIDDPLTDGTITYSQSNQQWAMYHGSTDERYAHGALGDLNEAYKLSILYWDDDTQRIEVSQTLTLPGNTIIYEGLAPMWADLNGDGVDDLLTTVADRGVGAQLRAYLLGTICDEDGTGTASSSSKAPKVYLAAESEYIGTAERWLHQLGVGPFGASGEIEIVQCTTPHIGGIIRYHRLVVDGSSARLEQVHAVDDGRLYTTHEYRSRNLDQVTIGDFNNDGIPEVVMTNFQQTRLVGLQRTLDGTQEVWSVDMPEPNMLSNIAVSCSGGEDETDTPMLLFATTPNFLVRVVFDWGTQSVGGIGNTAAVSKQSNGLSTPTCVEVPFSAVHQSRSSTIVMWAIMILCTFRMSFCRNS